MKLRVDGQRIFNDATKIVGNALDGFGLAFLPENMLTGHVADGILEALALERSQA